MEEQIQKLQSSGMLSPEAAQQMSNTTNQVNNAPVASYGNDTKLDDIGTVLGVSGFKKGTISKGKNEGKEYRVCKYEVATQKGNRKFTYWHQRNDDNTFKPVPNMGDNIQFAYKEEDDSFENQKGETVDYKKRTMLYWNPFTGEIAQQTPSTQPLNTQPLVQSTPSLSNVEEVKTAYLTKCKEQGIEGSVYHFIGVYMSNVLKDHEITKELTRVFNL